MKTCRRDFVCDKCVFSISSRLELVLYISTHSHHLLTVIQRHPETKNRPNTDTKLSYITN